jgi:hypothetical protein
MLKVKKKTFKSENNGVLSVWCQKLLVIFAHCLTKNQKTMRIRIPLNVLLSFVFTALLVLIGSLVFSQSSLPFGSDVAKGDVSTYWPAIALIISEAIAFLPTKFNGIAHAVVGIIGQLFKKKSIFLLRSN